MNNRELEYLKGYYADLKYLLADGDVGGLNHSTCGTPYFDNIEKAQKYVFELGQIIDNRNRASIMRIALEKIASYL
tara:strand:- start:24214 stop:24441 length:228 start_codon:yes stop_codon:yes gene_type:complete